MEVKSVFEVLNVIFVLGFLISGLCFTRLSIRHLDKKIKEEGEGTPSWDRGGMGLRVGMYAVTLIKNKSDKASLTEDEIILRHARPIDRVLAFSMSISLVAIFILWPLGKWLGYLV